MYKMPPTFTVRQTTASSSLNQTMFEVTNSLAYFAIVLGAAIAKVS